MYNLTIEQHGEFSYSLTEGNTIHPGAFGYYESLADAVSAAEDLADTTLVWVYEQYEGVDYWSATVWNS